MPSSVLNLCDAADLENDWPGQAADLRRVIPGVCTDWFPDDEGVTWNVERIAYLGDKAYVLVQPEPNDFGYDRLVVLVGISPRSSEFPVFAMYAQEQNSKFVLLVTDPDCPEDIPSAIIW